MSSVPVFVGLDYHQDSVQICVLNSEGDVLTNRSVENRADVISKWSRRHGQPKGIAIEACCGAANLAEELVTDWDLAVNLAHPGYVNRIKQSPDKTDFADARLLADLVRVNYLPKVWLAPQSTRELRRLVRHRSQLVARRKDTKLRIRGLLRENRLKCKTARAWTKEWYHWLNSVNLSESDRYVMEDHLEELISMTGRIAAVEAKIKIRTKDDPIVKRLLQLSGVGLITAVTIRAEVGRIDRFKSGKQLSRFCGVTPRNASSGTRQADAGLIRAGNPALRIVLVELAQRLMNQGTTRFGKLGQQLLYRGKPRNVAVAAVANRWVRWLYHELQRGDSTTSGPALQKESAPIRSAIASTSIDGAKADAMAKTKGARSI